MKALEILKAITENEGTHLWLDDGSGYPKSYIYEAIEELEDFKNRSCVTCKYGHPYSGKYIECSNSKTETEGLEFEKDFYCKNWESRWQ